METNLETLAKRIYEVAGKAPTKAYHEDWIKIMSLYPYQVVNKAWLQLRIEVKSFQYTDLKIWTDKCDYLHELEQKLEQQEKDRKRPSRVSMDSDMRNWKENLDNFTSGKITRGEYLKRAVDTKQMTIAEADKEANLYKRRGDSMDSYCKNTGLIKGNN